MQSSIKVVVFATLLCFVLVRGQEECDPISFSEEISRRFAYSFYFNIRRYARENNIMVAPWTVGSATAMLGTGAGSITKQQIWRVLYPSPDDRPFTNERQYACLLRMYEKSSGNDTSEETNQPLVASRLYADERFNFSDSYLRKTERYGPKLKKLDFSQNPGASRIEMNRWVASKTGNKIPQLFWEERITSEASLALPSAVYFKGLWKIAFRPEWTHTRKFKISDTKVVRTEFMKVNGKFRTYFDRDFRVRLIELPYQPSGNNNLSMILVTSKTTWKIHRTKFSRPEQMLSEQRLGPAMTRLFGTKPKDFYICMPKFKISQVYDMRWFLGETGLYAFSHWTADFTGMVEDRPSTYDDLLYIRDFIHKAVFEVDEKGGRKRCSYDR